MHCTQVCSVVEIWCDDDLYNYTGSVASDPPDKETLEETLGEGERGEEKSAFGFISPKPEPSQQSGFSFINSSDADHVEGGGIEEAKHSPEGSLTFHLK